MLSTMMLLTGLLTGISQARHEYSLAKNYTFPDFFEHFDFFSDADPTQGFVRYVDMPTANQTQLAGFASSEDFQNVVYLGVDYKNTTPGGRPSTRIESHDVFNHSTLWVADIMHMPWGCGIWPAYWLLGTPSPWPVAGEIDIIEGINRQETNMMVLHTNTSMTVTNLTDTMALDPTYRMRGTFSKLTCFGSRGCPAHSSAENSFGAGFNANGGGVLVTEFLDDAISIWNFARNEMVNRPDLTSGHPSPLSWRTPDAVFKPSDNSSLADRVYGLKVIINTAICGDWINKVWAGSECASLAPSCPEYVQNNPSVFEDAYWLIRGIQVYAGEETGAR